MIRKMVDGIIENNYSRIGIRVNGLTGVIPKKGYRNIFNFCVRPIAIRINIFPK